MYFERSRLVQQVDSSGIIREVIEFYEINRDGTEGVSITVDPRSVPSGEYRQEAIRKLLSSPVTKRDLSCTSNDD